MAQVVSTIFQFGKKNFVEDIVTHTDVNPPLEISFIIEADWPDESSSRSSGLSSLGHGWGRSLLFRRWPGWLLPRCGNPARFLENLLSVGGCRATHRLRLHRRRWVARYRHQHRHQHRQRAAAGGSRRARMPGIPRMPGRPGAPEALPRLSPPHGSRRRESLPRRNVSISFSIGRRRMKFLISYIAEEC